MRIDSYSITRIMYQEWMWWKVCRNASKINNDAKQTWIYREVKWKSS